MASFAAASTTRALVTRKTIGMPAVPAVRSRSARVTQTVRASAQKESYVAPVVAAAVVAATLVAPEIASATEASASVKALLGSVVNGGIVLLGIAGAISLVSGFDPVARK
ncbi:hypothetical protein BSKO_11450 [Bryopsis sp. KO-2023]|nr:hypothetical protein BSKO_11450 [Bryopsis sp. KO-2023]